MIGFNSKFLIESGFTVFINGISFVTLAALMRAIPAISREKLSLKWMMPGLFFIGFSRIIMAFAQLTSSTTLILPVNCFKLVALHFFLEFIRRSLTNVFQRNIPYLWHIPALMIFSLSFFLADTTATLDFLIALLGLFLCLIGLKASNNLPIPNIFVAKSCIAAATLSVALGITSKIYSYWQTSAHGHSNPFQPSTGFIEAVLMFFICAVILLGKFNHEKRMHDTSASLHSVGSPALFLLAIIALSASGSRIFNYMECQNKLQIETNLDNSIESLTQLINQRILFATTSSKILSDSPIMGQFIETPDASSTSLLDSFLNSFAANNPDDICYLMDSTGLVLAASAKKDLFIGNSLSSRPYFQNAISGKSGSLIDFGLFTNQLGYYSSNPVKRSIDGKIIGVCAVKRNLGDLEAYLKLYHPAMIISNDNKIFLSSDSKLVGKTLCLPDGQPAKPDHSGNVFTFSSQEFAHVTRAIDIHGWQILVLENAKSHKNNQIWLFTTIILITFLLITLLHGTVLANESRSGFRLAQEQFRLIFLHAPESILIISQVSLKILAANNSMLRQFELDGDATGKLYKSLMPAGEKAVRNAWHDNSQKIFKHERDFLQSDGKQFTAEVTGSQITFNGEPAILLLLHDISSHKQIELELLAAKNAAEEANQLKTRFFANASHEIRTPITAIIGLTELARSFCNSEEQLKILDLIKTSEKSLLTLLNDILDLARIEAGKFEIKPVPFSLTELLNNVVRLIRFKIGEKPVVTNLEVSRGSPANIVSDPDRIRQVLLNLLDNAVKFTERGHIAIRTHIRQQNSKAFLELQIEDTGNGIPPEIQAELFRPFVNTDPLQRNSERGAGLGLAICEQIISLMQGTITFSSVQGQGTTFSICVPIKIASAADLQTIQDTETSLPVRLKKNGEALRFLVADDNEINLFLASSIIEKFNGLSDCVKDGLEAIQMLSRNNYDALLIDIQMPRMDGIETIIKVRSTEKSHKLPIIAVSAFASEFEKARAISAGADLYLSKPYFPDDLLRAIKIVLELENSETESGTNKTDYQPAESGRQNDPVSYRQIDIKELELRILKKPENIAQISEIFARRSQTLLKDLEHCVKEDDLAKLRETSHSIKGLAGMLAAPKTFALAREMEELCRNEQFTQACQCIPVIETFIKEIALDLETLKNITNQPIT